MPELSAHEVPLNKIFSSDFEFLIPEYQRPYAWEVEQARELLDDLTDAYERDPDEPYFLGTLVLVKDKDRPQAEVIDGQQRLTTLTILLAIMRDLASDTQLHQQLDQMVRQPENMILKLASKPRLTLRPKDRDFFRTYVQEPGATLELIDSKPNVLETDSQRAIRRNAETLYAVLRGWSNEQRLGLVQMIAARTYLVAVSTSDLDSAHRIFGVMNARGLDLSPADIFKSRVIGSLVGDQATKYASAWEDAEELIGRDGFSDLFLHIRLIVSKQRGRLGLLREFPSQVLNNYLPDNAGEFVDEIVAPYASAYEQIRDQTFAAVSGSQSVNAWFKRLSQIDNNDWRAPALWALTHYGHDPVWLDAFLRKLERLAASMFLRREWTTPRVTRYIDLLREIDGGDHGLDAPSFELTDLEKRETIACLDGDVYLSQKTRKYVLLRIDELLANSPGASYDHSTITVEHVLPQSPAEDSQWVQAFDDEDRILWTNRLANLLLLNRTKNSEAQNFDFDNKKERYFSGKNGVAVFAITTQVLKEHQWTPALLRRRQQDLLEILAKEWALSS